MEGIRSQGNSEKVNQIVIRSNFKDLTPETLLAAFKEEGIRSLEDLAKRLTNALRDPEGLPQRVNYEELFSRPTPSELLATIEHPVPKVPFILDGIMHDPEDIVRYNGQELGFIPQAGGAELLVLRDKSVWAPFLRTVLLSRAASAGLTAAEGYQSARHSSVSPQAGTAMFAPPPTPPWLELWTDKNIGGFSLTLYSGESRRDLTKVGVWPWLSDFNDKITSVYRTTSLCMGFEHIHFQGSWLWLGPRETITADLSFEGWNDRISSVINSG